MPNINSAGPPQPLLVSILRQGSYLIASIHTALDDSQLLRFQRDLIDRVGRDRATGIIIRSPRWTAHSVEAARNPACPHWTRIASTGNNARP